MPRKGENIRKRERRTLGGALYQGVEARWPDSVWICLCTQIHPGERKTKPDSRCYFDAGSGSRHSDFHGMAGKSPIFC